MRVRHQGIIVFLKYCLGRGHPWDKNYRGVAWNRCCHPDLWYGSATTLRIVNNVNNMDMNGINVNFAYMDMENVKAGLIPDKNEHFKWKKRRKEKTW